MHREVLAYNAGSMHKTQPVSAWRNNKPEEWNVNKLRMAACMASVWRKAKLFDRIIYKFYNRISLEIAQAKLYYARQKQKATFLPMLYVATLFSLLLQFLQIFPFQCRQVVYFFLYWHTEISISRMLTISLWKWIVNKERLFYLCSFPLTPTVFWH